MDMPDLGLGVKDKIISKIRHISLPYGANSLGRKLDINQIIKQKGNYPCNNC